ncbi:MAG: sigma-70 family RNA polymerase sigma factor [Polyangiaceae bacterium]
MTTFVQVGVVQSAATETTNDAASASRLRALVIEHYDFVWRSLRRLGIADAAAEDATQKVLMVLSQRLSQIRPGTEKGFLYSTALHVAQHERRSFARKKEDANDDAVSAAVSRAPDPAEQLDAAQRRALLDEALDSLPIDFRAVFVLFEMEELTMIQISELLELPPGTIASRLRRARELFRESSKRLVSKQTRGAQ